MKKEGKKEIFDKWDVAVSVSSGALTAAIDVLWIDDISFIDAHKWGSAQVDEFVKKMAKSKGNKENSIAAAIKKLEDDFPMDGDLLTKEFGGGTQHHLRDFSHHPTPIGLIFSLLMQFTGKGYGTKTNGEFVTYDIPDWKKKGFEESIYCGTISWLFHLISDIAGSSGTRRDSKKEGTGLPGPLLSFLKEISSIPVIRSIAGKTDAKASPNKEENYVFSQVCSKLFNGTLLGDHDENGKPVLHGTLPFDLRTELGIVHESVTNKQYIPVLMNELIIAAFYSVRRFMYEIEFHSIESFEDLKSIDIRRCLPWKNETVKHMRMIATATFSTIDFSVAGIKAALKNKDTPTGFALDFMKGINYWGLGSFALATNSEVLLGVQKMYSGFVAAAQAQKQRMIANLPNGQQVFDTAKYAVETGISAAKIGTPIGFATAAIGVYDEILKAVKELHIAKEERMRIEEACTIKISIIKDNRYLMQETAEEYFQNKLSIFAEAFSTMDRAISMNDVDAYIMGNNMIQKELSGKTMFENRKEFDDLMLSDSALKF